MTEIYIANLHYVHASVKECNLLYVSINCIPFFFFIVISKRHLRTVTHYTSGIALPTKLTKSINMSLSALIYVMKKNTGVY